MSNLQLADGESARDLISEREKNLSKNLQQRYVLACVCAHVRVASSPVLSSLILTYSLPFSYMSFLHFLMIQARAISCHTSTASQEVRYVRVGERRVQEEDSGTIAHCAMPCILSFLLFWSSSFFISSPPVHLST